MRRFQLTVSCLALFAALSARADFNVRNYGATGNGTTDDTTAVNAAISAAGSNGTILFPEGTYKITSTLCCTSGSVTFKGAGARTLQSNISYQPSVNQALFNPGSCGTIAITALHIQQGNSNGSLVYNTACGNLLIDDSIIDGDAAAANTQPLIYSDQANTSIRRNLLHPANTYQYAISLNAVSDHLNINSEILDNRFESTGKGIIVGRAAGSTNQVEGLKISRNTFITTSTELVTIQAGFFFDISDNILDQSRYIAVWLNAVSGPIDSVVIAHNYLGLVSGGGVGVYSPSATYGTTNVIISANRFFSGTYGVATGGSTQAIVVADNILVGDNTPGSTGILTAGKANILGNIVSSYSISYSLSGSYTFVANQ